MRNRTSYASTFAGSTIVVVLLAVAVNLANAAPPTQNVNIINTPTVTVANPPANPVAVRDVNNPAFQPFQKFMIGSVNDGELSIAFDILTVPAGKRAVIETVTVQNSSPLGQKSRTYIITIVGGETGYHAIVLTPQGPLGTLEELSATTSIRLYADPGTVIRGFFDRSGYPTGIAGANVQISGYYVNVP